LANLEEVMSITDKTRKILWARSGNKCTLCKSNLVTLKSEPYTPIVVGEECHIISEAPNGPRHELLYNYNYDNYENLLLLCSNCHKVVDEQANYFTKPRLKEIKNNHEEEIRATLEKSDPNNLFKTVEEITILPKIKSGKELLNLLDECMALETDYEDTRDNEEVEFIASTMQTFIDYNDFLSMQSEPGPKISTIIELNSLLHDVEEKGFAIFGERKKKRIKFGNGSSDIWNVSLIYLMKVDNPNVIDLSKNSQL
jgi:5-methylcytosine-specific restriction endonuclease McrA